MKLYDIFFLVVCGIGTLNSFFMCLHFFFYKKGNPLLNRLFALIILTFSLRVSKKVWIFFFKETHPFFGSLWYVGYAVMIIAYFLYIYTLTGNRRHVFKSLGRLLLIQIPFIAIIMLTRIYQGELILFSSLVFFFTGALADTVNRIRKYSGKPPNTDKLPGMWSKGLFLFMTTIWLNSAAIFFFGGGFRYDFLTVEAFLFSLAIYILFYLEVRQGIVGKVHKFVSDEFVPDGTVLTKLRDRMDSDKIYLDHNLSLSSLAESLSVSPHYLSKLLNVSTGLNFNDYINRYRVEEAGRKLADPAENWKKIAAIAQESGFNSISVFNAAFKKFTAATPSKYLAKLQSR